MLIDKQELLYLERVNTLPSVNRRENFLGLTISIGKNETARPKQMVPENIFVIHCLEDFDSFGVNLG